MRPRLLTRALLVVVGVHLLFTNLRTFRLFHQTATRNVNLHPDKSVRARRGTRGSKQLFENKRTWKGMGVRNRKPSQVLKKKGAKGLSREGHKEVLDYAKTEMKKQQSRKIKGDGKESDFQGIETLPVASLFCSDCQFDPETMGNTTCLEHAQYIGDKGVLNATASFELVMTTQPKNCKRSSPGPESHYHEVLNLCPRWTKDVASCLQQILTNSDGRPSKLYETERNPAAFYTIFAGREKFLKLQAPYIEQLLKNGIVDEVHLHDFSCRFNNPPSDRQYMNQLQADIPGIFLATHIAPSCHWGSYYSLYAERSLDEDIIVKGDDDIVFIDTTRVQGFLESIRMHPGVFLWSANVVNNGKAAVFQQRNGMLNDSFIADKVNWEEESHPTNFPNPMFNGYGKLFRNGNVGREIHKYFLEHSQQFFEVRPDQPLVYWVKNRISINFIAILGRNFEAAYEMVNTKKNDDEHALTYYASVNMEKKLMVYMPLVVAHASFGPQNIGDNVAKLYEGVNIQNNSTWSFEPLQFEKLPTICWSDKVPL